jgi:hypothetical protein
MNQVDKISKEALILLNYAKDTAVANLTVANNKGQLDPKLEPAQLLAVIDVFTSSLSQGYQKGLGSFQKIVKEQVMTSQTKKVAEISNKKSKS